MEAIMEPIILSNAVINHKISILRNKATRPGLFRSIVKEIGMIETYEALKAFQGKQIQVETPLETCTGLTLEDEEICFVSILRAGLAMGDGAREMLPCASEGFIAMARDEATFLPHLSYAKLPTHLENKKVILLDPMLATGGSSGDAVKLLKEKGANVIAFCCIIAAPEGAKRFTQENPEVALYIGALDRCLNEKAYILPGLGDAGDRIYGTLD